MLLLNARLLRVVSMAVCLGVVIHPGPMRGQNAAAAVGKNPEVEAARGKIAFAAPSDAAIVT